MSLRAGYACEDDGEGYQGVLRAMHPCEGGVEPGDIVWTCEHSHPAPRKSSFPRHGSPVFTSALDCAKAELARRADPAAPINPTEGTQ